ncbi:hypothetical protein AVEN_252457-1 [Araneus ventricosus]|uniref:Uncharacterized protein n=1 Tax=Araneus ventricosus TaxID=182803 RepID=A0A4Y2ARF9_ARAVE|nr:hypothetical protein AVEN_252457-1 [Araneus ventricosus]
MNCPSRTRKRERESVAMAMLSAGLRDYLSNGVGALEDQSGSQLLLPQDRGEGDPITTLLFLPSKVSISATEYAQRLVIRRTTIFRAVLWILRHKYGVGPTANEKSE